MFSDGCLSHFKRERRGKERGGGGGEAADQVSKEDPPLDRHNIFNQRLYLIQLCLREAEGHMCAALGRHTN